jgi:cis-L-3-hydroxyproline dehydratase
MILTDEEQKMCDGAYGPGMEKAMNLLIQFGEAFEAERMLEVKSCHILNSDPFDWVLDVTEGVKEVRTFTTTHPLVPPLKWKAMGIPENMVKEQLTHAKKRYELYRRLGINLTSTCIACFIGDFLKKGDVFCWSGTEGSIFANSIFGALGNREAGPISFLSAITGKTPEILLHKQENRYGQFLVEMEQLDWSHFNKAKYGALGYYIGNITKDKNVVITGMPDCGFDEMKHLLSALPVSGTTGICHIVGLTPEAPSLEDALGHSLPEDKIRVGEKEISQAWDELATAKGSNVDIIALGCPHSSIKEFREVASLLQGKKISGNVSLWIAASDQTAILARRMGYSDIIEKSGGVITDTCIGVVAPWMKNKKVATNSARVAYFTAFLGVNEILYGSMKDCLSAAINGNWRA